MALYDGFFDSEYNEDTDEYDRGYDVDDFLTYFDQIVGSGVCVFRNEDSYRVRLADGNAVVSPGYLFITGHWLKNDADYVVPLAGAGIQAIVAHLNTSAKRIDIETRSVAQSYPDSLVLALVDPASSSVEDTRYNGDICGVIDAAGSVSSKVEWAVNYIDNEIEAKLAQIQTNIDAQATALDLKIAEVQALTEKIVPDPVGSIKFSASQNVGPDWLLCDGSFVNEEDYPELVAALGKLTPGVEDFTEILGHRQAEQMSNHCIVDNTVWVYLVKSRKLVGLSAAGKKEIPVTGVGDIVENPGIDVVLSICGGSAYLAQNNYTADLFTLLECSNFKGTESSITMTKLDAAGKKSTTVPVTKFSGSVYPSVVGVGGTKYMVLGIADSYYANNSYKNAKIHVLSWKQGSFDSSASLDTTSFPRMSTINDDNYRNVIEGMKSKFAFSGKNFNELLTGYLHGSNLGSSYSSYTMVVYSKIQELFGALPDNVTTVKEFSQDLNTKYDEKFYFKREYLNQIIFPVAGNNEYLWSVEIVKSNLVVYHGKYNPQTPFDWYTVPIKLPSRARIFTQSAVYASTQGIWFIFTGTGLLFSESLENGTWGYLDTTSILGTITQYGCLDYDGSTNTLYISGADTTGTPRVGKLILPDIYSYANDGAWLPLIASDGVPAYIKAVSDGGEGGGGDNTEYISKKITVTVRNDFGSWATVLFNGESLIAGTYNRNLPKNGTFSVGLRTTRKSSNSNYAASVSMNGTTIANVSIASNVGTVETLTFNVSDISGDIALVATIA